jgi:hypothetical protein
MSTYRTGDHDPHCRPSRHRRPVVTVHIPGDVDIQDRSSRRTSPAITTSTTGCRCPHPRGCRHTRPVITTSMTSCHCPQPRGCRHTRPAITTHNPGHGDIDDRSSLSTTLGMSTYKTAITTHIPGHGDIDDRSSRSTTPGTSTYKTGDHDPHPRPPRHRRPLVTARRRHQGQRPTSHARWRRAPLAWTPPSRRRRETERRGPSGPERGGERTPGRAKFARDPSCEVHRPERARGPLMDVRSPR